MLVLIVDDCLDTCDVLRTYLQLDMHEVHCALTSHAALQFVAEHKYQVILMDLWMPDMDGYALAKAVRRLYSHQHEARIIALSGAPYDPSQPCAKAAAFDGFLSKPVEMGGLVRSLAVASGAAH